MPIAIINNYNNHFNILGFRNALVLNAKHESEVGIKDAEIRVLNERLNPESQLAELSPPIGTGVGLTSPTEASSLLLAPNIISPNTEANTGVPEPAPSPR